MADNLKEKFSEELKSLRESKGISLEQIASKTRIDIKFLAAIEEGNFEVIDEIYIRAFIREYAQMLDLDGNEIIAGYDAVKKGEHSDAKIIDLSKKDNRDKVVKKEFDSNAKSAHASPDEVTQSTLSDQQKKMLFFGGIGLTAVVVIVLLFVFVFNSSTSQIITEPDIEDVISEQAERYTTNTDAKNVSTQTLQDSLVLKLVATDTSWVLINKDDVSNEEYTMYPGVVKNSKALRKFHLTLGNSGGIALFLNGDSLHFAGSKGRVRYLVVDKAGLRIVTNKASQENE